MYVCNTITFENLYVESSFSLIRYISRSHRSNSYMKVIGTRSRSQKQKGRKYSFPQKCRNSVGNNSGSMRHKAIDNEQHEKYSYISSQTMSLFKNRAMKFACILRFSDMADRMVWPPSLSRDQKWPSVTKCTHSRMVGLRLEGNLAIIIFGPPAQCRRREN